MSLAVILRIGSQAALLFASGWLLRDPSAVPLWQIGIGLILAAGIVWMYFREA